MIPIAPMLNFGLYWSEQLRVAPLVESSEEQEAELTKLARLKGMSVRLAELLLSAHAGSFPERSSTETREAVDAHHSRIAEFSENHLSILR